MLATRQMPQSQHWQLLNVIPRIMQDFYKIPTVGPDAKMQI
jgi:hypothetical protein